MKVKLNVTVNISKKWVDDGLTVERLITLLKAFLGHDMIPFAYAGEIKAVIKEVK